MRSGSRCHVWAGSVVFVGVTVAIFITLVVALAAHGVPLVGAASGANVQVSHHRYQMYGEPDLAVNPHNPQNLLAAAQCIGGSPLRRVPCTFVSFDGGRTWHENGRLPRRPGDEEGVDLSVGFNRQGVAFVASMASPNSGADSVLVWRSGDGGRTFSRPVTLYRGYTSDWGADHPWLAVDTSGGAHAGSVYVVWMEGRRSNERITWGHLLFSRSVDGGHTFTKPRAIVALPGTVAGGAVMTIGPSGTIHVMYAYFAAGLNPAHSPFPAVMRATVRSTDGGRTFGPSRRIGAAPFDLSFGRVQSLNLQAAATDLRAGTVYMVMSGYRENSHRAGILLWRSSDNGSTWRGPVSVDDDVPGLGEQCLQPRVVVTPRGTVYVSYFGLAHGRISVLMARSTSHGANFDAATRISTTSFDPRLTPWIGDYQALAVGLHTVYPLWNDTRTGNMELFTTAIPAV